ncbi:limbic system-associated membrane protein isoform X2 [Nilaparvata lugens]|uniref:limbic system-associated membrane protein isoform X2 n=1 Tax=Nilaparvata lugens TaxID=108931 RepID=UPI00193CB3AE|nr:limbic system-associated membrane protein isoform X2 [Nilaparvata lugens]
MEASVCRRLLCAFTAASVVALAAPNELVTEVPKFGKTIDNVTIPVSREAVLDCIVEDLGSYKVAWLRVDTQTILTIHGHVITKNHRIGVTHSDQHTWQLHIKDVRESDRGWYMCQINTDPMKSQLGFLQVVVPPDILDYPTSTDMVVREGSNVTLRCEASGSPAPSITWRREGSETIPLATGEEVASVEGTTLNIPKVNRLHMGAYLCIASNGVPPTPSKRIMLIVHFAPMMTIQNQLIGAQEGNSVTLECNSEAFPKSINYWTKANGEIITRNSKYEPELHDVNAYKSQMRLTINYVEEEDYTTYKCIAKNSLGETDGSIKLYHIPGPSTTTQSTAATDLPLARKDGTTKRKLKKTAPEVAQAASSSGSFARVCVYSLRLSLGLVLLTLPL